MKTFEYKTALVKELTERKQQGKSVGFVPTMGAIHQGHVSLISNSVKDNDITVVSIFVNPTQFNDSNDLKNYPRTLESDLKLIESAGCDIVFTPTEKEMYPETDTRQFDFGGLDKTMEGAHRPGHFNGVAQIVTRLFDIVMPQRAYFGEKDFQQLAIIKKITSDYNYPIEIVPCPIVREKDGLAMSSRNKLLNNEQRKHAVLISKILFQAQNLSGKLSVKEVKDWVTENIKKDPFLKIEYFEIVDAEKLRFVNSWEEPGIKMGCIATRVGNIRLIDNVKFIS